MSTKDAGSADNSQAADDARSDEFEVSSLRRGARPPRRTPRPASTVPGDLRQSRAEGETPAAESSRYASRRRRMLAGALALCAVALALVALLAGSPSSRHTLHALVAGPTPTATATLSPSDKTIAIMDVVPWGKLTVDGKPYPPGTNLAFGAATTAYQKQGPWPQITLPRGRHTLSFVASPFPPVKCSISVPAAPTHDSCPLVPLTDSQMNSSYSGRVITFHETPDKLPAAQYQSLEQFALAHVTTTPQLMPLAPGDHYLDSTGQVQTATTAMTAEMALAVATDMTQNPMGPGKCTTICPSQWQQDGTWQVVVRLNVRWRYTAADGTDLGTSVDATVPNGLSSPAYVYLSTVWDASSKAWQDGNFPNGMPIPNQIQLTGSQVFNAPSCTFVSYTSEPQRAQAEQQATNSDGTSINTSIIPPDNYGEGCVMSIQAHATPNTNRAYVPYTAGDALFLYRCGVLTALNPPAHALDNSLPVAGPHETQIAMPWVQTAVKAVQQNAGLP